MRHECRKVRSNVFRRLNKKPPGVAGGSSPKQGSQTSLQVWLVQHIHFTRGKVVVIRADHLEPHFPSRENMSVIILEPHLRGSYFPGETGDCIRRVPSLGHTAKRRRLCRLLNGNKQGRGRVGNGFLEIKQPINGTFLERVVAPGEVMGRRGVYRCQWCERLHRSGRHRGGRAGRGRHRKEATKRDQQDE